MGVPAPKSRLTAWPTVGPPTPPSPPARPIDVPARSRYLICSSAAEETISPVSSTYTPSLWLRTGGGDPTVSKR